MDFVKLEKDTITVQQFEQLIHLEETCGLEPFSPEMLQECIEDMDTYAFTEGDTILGFITIHSSVRYFGGGLYIVNLNVSRDKRRCGIGEKLMRTALAQYSQYSNVTVTLDVAKDNAAALNLYQKLRFILTDLPSGNGENDYVMIARLGKLLGSVKTERLFLRPIPLSDADQLADILRNDTVKQTYMVPDLTEDAALTLAKKIALLSADSSRYIRGIYLDGALIGQLNDVSTENGSIELGWFIHPDYHNKGIATEAAKAAIDDLFTKGYDQVVAGAFSENLASMRVMQKAGMQLQEFTEEIEYRGKIHHCIYYAIRRTV